MPYTQGDLPYCFALTLPVIYLVGNSTTGEQLMPGQIDKKSVRHFSFP
jgi:hypothetical protein